MWDTLSPLTRKSRLVFIQLVDDAGFLQARYRNLGYSAKPPILSLLFSQNIASRTRGLERLWHGRMNEVRRVRKVGSVRMVR